MPFVSGFLRVRSGSGGGEHPDQGLPGHEGPVDPGYGIGIEHPDQGLPTPPPGMWPPPVPSHPIVIAPPNTPPGVIWPTPNPPRPDQGLPRPPVSGGGAPPRPDQGLPAQPAVPTHPIASSTYWMLVYTPGHGWKYVSVDPSLSVDNTLPAQPPPVPTPHK